MKASPIKKFAKSAQQNKCQVSRTAYITAQLKIFWNLCASWDNESTVNGSLSKVLCINKTRERWIEYFSDVLPFSFSISSVAKVIFKVWNASICRTKNLNDFRRFFFSFFLLCFSNLRKCEETKRKISRSFERRYYHYRNLNIFIKFLVMQQSSKWSERSVSH